MPLTFSFRLNEKEFLDDLQAFSKFFRSVEENVSPELVKPVDKNGTYYNFDIKYQKPDNNQLVQGRKFKNPELTEIQTDGVFYSGKNLWILKPSGLNRGKGLELFSSLGELNEFLKLYTTGYEVKEFASMQYNDSDNISPSLVQSTASQKKLDEGKDGQGGTHQAFRSREHKGKTTFPSFVIQKYIEKPLTYKNHKFDIRAFGLLNQDMELFVFSEAYIRLSSLEYSLEKMNYFIHLTNNAVQVKSDSYGSLIKGNIVGIKAFEVSRRLNHRNSPRKKAAST